MSSKGIFAHCLQYREVEACDDDWVFPEVSFDTGGQSYIKAQAQAPVFSWSRTMSDSDSRRGVFTAIREDETASPDEKLKRMTEEYLVDNPALSFMQAFNRVIQSEHALHV